MGSFTDTIKQLFSHSGSIPKTPFASLRPQVSSWRKLRTYPSAHELPPCIEFPRQFWKRIGEIYRHTTGDGHERAVAVWWADGEYVLTDSIRGEKTKVTLPRQQVKVSYKHIPNTSRAKHIISVNGKTYAKRTVEMSSISKKKNIEVEFLFSMHTHPPYSKDSNTGTTEYMYFSPVDIRSFIGSGTIITGLVTDVVWLLIRTKKTPGTFRLDDSAIITPEYLITQLHIQVYKAEMGRGAVSYEKVLLPRIHNK